MKDNQNATKAAPEPQHWIAPPSLPVQKRRLTRQTARVPGRRPGFDPAVGSVGRLSPNRAGCSYRGAVRFPDSCCRRVSALRRPDSGSSAACCCCWRRADAALSRRCCGTSPGSSGTLPRASSLSSHRNQDPAEMASLLPIWSGSMNT